MGNKVNCIHTIDFTKETKIIKQNWRKMGLRLFPMNFHGCVSLKLSQSEYHPLIFDHL